MVGVSKNRNLGLDLMRLVAIYLVLLDHGGQNPFGEVLLGGLGVEVFFILSGFLIGRIIIREFDDFKGASTFKHFWVNRWFRTLPLYYLALIIQIILSQDVDWGYLFYFVFLQNNFFGVSLYPISWSLVVEEWFYLGLPFVFLFFTTIFKKVKITHLVAYIVFLVLLKFILISLLNIPFQGVNGNVLLRFDSMLVGVVLAMLNLRHFELYKRIAHPVIFCLGIACIVLLQYIVFIKVGLDDLNQSTLFKTAYFLGQSFFIGLTLPFLNLSRVTNSGILALAPIRSFITWTSILSYSFYLFHMNIFHFIQNLKLGGPTYIISLLALYLVSYVIYKFYEKPLTNLRAKFN